MTPSCSPVTWSTPRNPRTARPCSPPQRRHLAPEGRLIIEWHPPKWFATVASGQGGRLGEVEIELADVVHDGDLLSATVCYAARGRRWHQEFTCRRLGVETLLTSADLAFDGWLSADRTWYAARPGRVG